MNQSANFICKALILYFVFPVLPTLPVSALPPPEDLPEEVLRTQIITEARSPVDGKPLTAAQYAELKAALQPEALRSPIVNRKLRHLLFLLRVRQQIRLILPFL